ncbi:hypothetical protein ACFWN2_38930 [Lentzea sp. NPDC058436]|uniref:hypothetical protein n=1 Tax=Lentzea sp. NPDC058436 TaxID=3346499 RepID=UPI00365CA2AC
MRRRASPGLAEHLVEAGFSEDEPTYVMVVERDRALSTFELPENMRWPADEEEADEIRLATPALQRFWEDEGGNVTWCVREPDGVFWWHEAIGDKFIEFGMTDAHREFGPLPPIMAPNRTRARLHLLVEGVGDGDFAVNSPYDLRFGTVGDHHEDSLCVWGDELLAEVSDEPDAAAHQRREELNQAN